MRAPSPVVRCVTAEQAVCLELMAKAARQARAINDAKKSIWLLAVSDKLSANRR